MDEDNVFVIDTTPTSARERDLNTPQYQIARKSVELTKFEEFVNTPIRTRFNATNSPNQCWNCGKRTHSIRDCRVERNNITLEWNKELQILSKNYQNRKFQKGTGRYHQTEKISDYYAHITPGIVSPKLRKVLGLSSCDLPPYIYRLRKHGYPKAWLKHATVKPSGISLYDAHGNEVADPDAEDGEILEEEDKIRYDLSKLIQFPGFNAPLPENAVDDFKKYDILPFNEEQSLELMVKDLQEKAVTEYCLKKSKLTKVIPAKMVNSSDVDMEVEFLNDSIEVTKNDADFIPPLPCDKLELPAAPPENLSRSGSPNPTVDESLDPQPPSCSNRKNTPVKSDLGKILSSSEGTPLLQSKSKHSRLPPAENFSKDISDVINFENLPESTGKFEKMRGLLKKVKQILGLQKQTA